MRQTAKQKAEELVIKMDMVTYADQGEGDSNYIRCALVAVDEILQIFNNEWTKLDFWTAEINGTINFWQEVKQELEKIKNETK